MHVVFAPCPLMGHLVSMLRLAELILRNSSPRRRITATVIAIPPLHPDPHLSSSISTASSSIPNLSFLHLQPQTPPPFPTFPSQALASLILHFYAPQVRSAVSTLLSTAPVAAFVLDFLFIDFMDVAIELGIPPYVLYTSSAAMLGLTLRYRTLDPQLPEDKMAVEMVGETIHFPGFASNLPLEALPDSTGMGKNENYRWFLHLSRRLLEVKGLLLNTFTGLEPAVIKALQEGLFTIDNPTPPVHPIGPVISMKLGEIEHECIRWLNEQPRGSVVFLCFGSMGSFSETQTWDIAMGLERTGHRFLWVLRAPPKKEHCKYASSCDAVLEKALPDGFLVRTRERGLVWPSFAPQAEILGHEAVGGFVTHCGWNSCMESLWFGVPMAAWPLYAEQHMIAFELAKEMGVAVEVKTERLKGNMAAAKEVERAVRVLMGEESAAVRGKVREMREEARKAVQVGGSSYRSLEALIGEWEGP